MGCEAGGCNKTSTPYAIFIVTPSLEEWPTKAKLTLLDSISMSWGNICRMPKLIIATKNNLTF